MPLIRDAWRSLRRNPALAGGFVACVVVLNALLIGLMRLMHAFAPAEVPKWMTGLELGSMLIANVLLAALFAVFFARLGRELDRPLWKSPGDTGALERFFSPWLVLLLFEFCTQYGLSRAAAAENAQLVVTLSFFALLAMALLVPLGACIMYAGGWRKDEPLEVFHPLTHEPAATANVLMLGLGRFVLLSLSPLVIGGVLGFVYQLVIVAADAALILLIFAATWRLCMLHRDTPRNDDYMDF